MPSGGFTKSVCCHSSSTCSRKTPKTPRSMEPSVILPRCVLQLPTAQATNPLKILQWNILADGLAQFGEFTRVADQHLTWEARAPLILAELQQADADVVCLQEVNHFDTWLQPQLAAMGYIGSFLPKPRSACQTYGFPPDGCAIFYKQDATEPGSQGVLLVHLQQKDGGGCLTVACTHLKAKAGEANELLREFQAQQLCSFVQMQTATIQQQSAHAVVVCGDFNTTPDQPACQIMAAAGFVSTWEAAKGVLPEDVYSTWKFRPAGEKKSLIDYVWYAGEGSLCPLAVWSMPSESDIGANGLPSAQYPSDHLAVWVEFGWRP